jgi:hypothetical protein
VKRALVERYFTILILKVQLKVDKSQKNQRWIFETIYLVAPATYVIKNVKTGTVMDLEGAKEGEGVRIIGFHKNGSANQKVSTGALFIVNTNIEEEW